MLTMAMLRQATAHRLIDPIRCRVVCASPLRREDTVLSNRCRPHVPFDAQSSLSHEEDYSTCQPYRGRHTSGLQTHHNGQLHALPVPKTKTCHFHFVAPPCFCVCLDLCLDLCCSGVVHSFRHSTVQYSILLLLFYRMLACLLARLLAYRIHHYRHPALSSPCPTLPKPYLKQPLIGAEQTSWQSKSDKVTRKSGPVRSHVGQQPCIACVHASFSAGALRLVCRVYYSTHAACLLYYGFE